MCGSKAGDLEVVLHVNGECVGDHASCQKTKSKKFGAAAVQAVGFVASQCVRSSAIRAAARPSQSSGTRPRLPAPAMISSSSVNVSSRFLSDQAVGTLLERDGPLGVVAQGEARNAQRRAFFLEPTGVGQHHRGG